MKLTRNFLLPILLFTFILSDLCAQDFAIDPETSEALPNFHGRVIKVKGQVFKTNPKNDKKSELAMNSKVFSGDTVNTGKNSFAKLEMNDDTMITLGPETTFEITSYQFRSKKDRTAVFGLYKGQIQTDVRTKALPGQMIFKTRTVSMGVRGTQFAANVHKNVQGNEVSEFALVHGAVEVHSNLSDKTVGLKPGQHFIVIEKNNGQSYDEGVKELDPALRKSLENGFKSEGFPGMLPYYAKLGVVESSVQDVPDASIQNADKVQRSGSNWKDNLQELNKKLQQYNEAEPLPTVSP